MYFYVDSMIDTRKNFPLSIAKSSRAFSCANVSTELNGILSRRMPTYAMLGATGNTGLNILRVLTKTQSYAQDPVHIHAYARSKSKLLSSHPDAASDDRVSIFAGVLEDLDLLASCLKGANAIFLAVAVSDNIPGCQIAQNTASLVIEALERLKQLDKEHY